MTLVSVLYRLVAELACLTGVICAAMLAYADKSPLVWAWFLLFGFCNIIFSSKQSETKVTSKTEAAGT